MPAKREGKKTAEGRKPTEGQVPAGEFEEIELPVGLLFAGSFTHTIANHIKDVLTALNVTIVV